MFRRGSTQHALRIFVIDPLVHIHQKKNITLKIAGKIATVNIEEVLAKSFAGIVLCTLCFQECNTLTKL
jgi:hypothetical protein